MVVLVLGTHSSERELKVGTMLSHNIKGSIDLIMKMGRGTERSIQTRVEGQNTSNMPRMSKRNGQKSVGDIGEWIGML